MNAGVLDASPGYSIYQILGIVIIFTIFASVVSYSKHIFPALPPLSSLPLIGPLLTKKEHEVDSPNGGPAPLEYPNATGGSGSSSGESHGRKPDPIPESSNVSPKEPPPAASAEQTWCFVGEDMAGRWCMQVPGPKACDPDRTFHNKNSCEHGM
jgi:hypothetical protein